MSQGRSFTARAVLAVVLMVLFYALAAGVVVGTGWLAYYLLRSFLETGRATGYLAVLFFACAGVCVIVVWSVLPRFNRFEPPGPEATPAQHPELFVEVERIASATGQQRPEHVYLVPAVNAFVAQRGGIMGVGSRRVMGIGLPLMRSLHVDELRAVLAHEMGHFHGGDTRLGP